MKAGATYNLIVKLPEITDEPSEQEIIDEIIFTIQCGSVQLSKVYPSDVSLNGDIYLIPLNQSETKQLVGNCQLEAQVNYTNKAVQKSYIQSFTVSNTLATKDVEGVPDSVHNAELILKLIGSDVLVINIVPEVADKIIKNMNELYQATKQAMEDTQSYGEQTKSDLQLKLQDALGSINDVAIGQLESINTTAVAQIEAINTVAKQNIETETNSIVQAAQGQIVGINQVASGQINAINKTATSQIDAINKTATSQIDAINKTAQAQSKALDTQAEEIYTNLGRPSTTFTQSVGYHAPGSTSEPTPLHVISRKGIYVRLDSLTIDGQDTELGKDDTYLSILFSESENGGGLNVRLDITEKDKKYDISDYPDTCKYMTFGVYSLHYPHQYATVKYTLYEYDVRAELDEMQSDILALQQALNGVDELIGGDDDE